jgi:hypothetical protein
MSSRLVILEANCLFEFFNRLIKFPHSSQAHSHVKAGLILKTCIGEVFKCSLIVVDGLLELVQLCLHHCSVKEKSAVCIIFLNGRLIVTQGFLVLTQLVVALTRIVPVLTDILLVPPLFC